MHRVLLPIRLGAAAVLVLFSAVAIFLLPSVALKIAFVAIGAVATYFVFSTATEFEKLRKAEDLHKNILEGIIDSLFSLDSSGRITFITPRAAELFHAGADNLLGRSIRTVAFPQDPGFVENIERALTEKRALRFEQFSGHLNRWFEHQIYVNAEGGISVYGRDITASRRLEEALRASEERFRRLVDSNIVGVSVVDSHCVTEANDTFLEMLGRTREDLLRQQLSCQELTPGEYGEFDRIARQQISENGFCHPYEKELTRKDGSRVPVIVAATRVDSGSKNAEPSEWECLNIVVDLSEQKRSERRLRNIVEASKVLASTLDHDRTLKDLARFVVSSLSEWCVIVLRDDEKVRRATLAIRDQKQISVHSAEGQSWSLSQIPWLRSVFQKGVSEAFESAEGGESWVNVLFPETELRQAILRQLPLSCFAVPMPSRGKISAALLLGTCKAHAFTQDDLHLAEEIGRRAGIALENARLYRETQEANRLKDEFVSVVSHELRTPLTPILGAVYMLRSEPNDRNVFLRALDLIERNAKAQAKLVEDLLDISRVISGKMRLTLQPVDIPSTIHAAVEAVRSASDAKEINIQVQMNPLNGIVFGDPNRLQQVVWNLLANAVKFTPVSGCVVVDLCDKGEHAEIHVMDDGIGIAPEFLPFVFDGFRQQDGSRTRVHGGLGLGLAIVRHVVELHGGTVQAQNLNDRSGCAFIVKLPLRAMSTARSASA